MIPYTHKVHRLARSLKLKVEPSGEVVVVSPKHVPSKLIQDFVNSHLEWIAKTQAKLRAVTPTASYDRMQLFGREYQLAVTEEPNFKLGVTLKESALIIRLPSRNQTPSLKSPRVKQELEKYLKATAEKYIVPRTHQLADIMHIKFGRITLREQKSRWGSCSSQGNLNFNWRLVHYPPAVIDYVIIHELAHRKHMNHSTAFWNFVREYDPEFLKHRGWLKRHGLNVT